MPYLFSLPSLGDAEQAAALLSERYSVEVETFTTNLDKVIAAYAAAHQGLLERQASLISLDKAISEQATRITAQNERLDSAVAQLNHDAVALERQREERFQAWTREKTDELGQKFDELRGQLDNVVSGSNVQAKKHLDELQEFRRQAATTINVIGNIAATGDYREVARVNDQDADRLRNGALAMLLLLVGVVTYVVFSFNASLSWQHVLYRLSAAMLLLLPAGYLAVESARHREVARRMKRIELEIASVDAFTALLPMDLRVTLKADLTKKYFGNMAEPAAAARSDMTARQLMKELRLILRAFRGGKSEDA